MTVAPPTKTVPASSSSRNHWDIVRLGEGKASRPAKATG